ncbi:2-amino-4-hydroxy-6-hydroxymethyldihydropteridine diphosphokinase [Dokdonella sp.]|uniref:2-amino-4-hydroxy-6- hydroxymethyldihydropteridine diphosphokinase n=1 Tax=Dokdonella sp. TaxID=2291710 RepID=UPI0031BECA37|nr:2-amino-4-hydroxy-6-hydroxymethyldihydropteridine diphosphokinase [Dokdonella sp.]
MPEAGAHGTALIGIGSNLGDPIGHVLGALAALGRIPESSLLARSRLYRTVPWGITEQPPFVNAVAELATTLSAQALLAHLLVIERAHGRRRDGSRWGPRSLDLDLLALGDLQLDEPGLTLPHPHLASRAFVLVPLAELGTERAIVGVGRVGELLARVDASGCVPVAALEIGRSDAE